MAVSIIDGSVTTCGSGGAIVPPAVGGAPGNARYWVGQAHADLTAEMDLGALSSGLVFSTVSAGLATPSTIANGTNGHVLTMVAGAPAWAAPSGGGGGVTDHGALTGLADDDHPQYVRVVTAGAGLTGGGSGGALTVDVVAADSTITVNANSIQVGQIANANVAAGAAIDFSKLANLAGLSVLGRSGVAAGAMAAITSGAAELVLRADLTNNAIAFGQVTTGGIADAAVTSAKIRNSIANSVIGRAGNTGGVVNDIAAATTGHALRFDGTNIGFGTLAAGAFTGTQTNGFVLTLSGGVPTWLAASGGISGSGVANQVTYWSGTSTVTGATGFTYDPSTVFLLVENTGTGNAGSIRTSNTNSGALMTLSSQGGGVGGTFGGVTDQSTNMIACTGTLKQGPTGNFPWHFITNNLIRMSVLGGGTLDIYATTAPATPASGHTYYYHDTSDNRMKLKDSAGVVTVLN